MSGAAVRADDVRDVIVAAVIPEADGVVSLVLTPVDEDKLPTWEAGAHIDVLLRPGLERQYSLCGDPADRRQWKIDVLREPQSRGGSAWIHEGLKAGDVIQVRGPRNNFPLVAADRYLSSPVVSASPRSCR